MKTVLVTGADGQLGKCIKDVAKSTEKIQFIYTNSSELDITNKASVFSFFADEKIDYCINCAAYTAVDKAESEIEKATKINADGVQNLAEICKETETILIHISTDFVFDGTKNTPYLETNKTNPKGVYGSTKLQGEEAIKNVLKKYFIIRTSWLYSEYGSNFMKTMLKLGKDKNKLSVVNDQKGTPTYAVDLAKVILKIIETNSNNFGIYHYSNKGVTTWYEFAQEIFKESKIPIDLKSVTTEEYPTAAERPKYSVLDSSKIKNDLQIEIHFWKKNLKKALQNFSKYEKNQK
ncbi:MAG: dTDP-4-dehydrorhamnose reductase [Flavobacteriaceae bacterium]|nr:dTDP-4-dehydrorhamnose reductase [Flavobacteriaceae bacterium]